MRQAMETDAGRDFRTTAWSQLVAASNPYAALRHLAERYWRPIYAFIRVRERCPGDDAKDLTQDFFLWVIESGFLAKLKPGLGRFRAFLKTALANYLTDRRRASAAAKRGGLAKHLSLDVIGQSPPAVSDSEQDPEAVLDRQWREAVVARAELALDEAFAKDGRADWVRLWRDYDVSPGASEVDHAGLAERYGITRRDVSYRLTTVRQKFAEIVVELVSQTVTDPESLDGELRELFGPSFGKSAAQ